MKALFKELNNQRLSLLFSIILTYWAMTSFFGMPIIDILLMSSLVNTVLYICFIFLKKQGIAGGVLFVLGSIVYFIGIEGIILFSGETNLSYLIWIIVARPETAQVVPAFWYATILIAAYGLSSTVYYFTNVSFRISVLLLIGIIPFMLQSAKTDSDITIPFLLFVIVFFWLYVESTAKKTIEFKKGFHVNNPWYILSVVIFIGIVMTFALIVPKPETIPKIAYINQVINQTIQNLAQTNGQNIDAQNLANIFNTMGIKNQSILDSSTPPLGDNVLFEVKANESLYFRVQSWDKYADNRWLKGNKILDEKKDVKEMKSSYYKFSLLAELLQRMKKNGLLSSEYSKIDNYLEKTIKPQEIKQASIYTKGVPMQALLNPPGVCGFSLPNNPTVYINERSECYMANEQMPYINENYVIDYFTQNLSHSSLEFNLIRQLNREFVTDIFDVEKYKVNSKGGALEEELSDGLLVIDFETKDVIEEANYEMKITYENYTKLPGDISQRIYDLAESITEGLDSDYDKAEAIVSFFATTGFEYDLTPPSMPRGMDYNDFFIFESKSGICMHYASAMVILARAAGIPARYVEGFVANEWDPETGDYLIREKNAHAFPEVYISGYGWMVFEPTVGMRGDSDNRFSVFFEGLFNTINHIVSSIWNFILAMPIWVKLLFIPYIVFTFIVLIWLFYRIRRSVWKKRVLNADSSQSLLLVFAKVSHLLMKINLDMKKYETPSNYAVRVLENSGVDLLEFVDIFNKSKYGGLNPDKEAISNAMEKYNEVRQIVKKRVGRMKAWIL